MTIAHRFILTNGKEIIGEDMRFRFRSNAEAACYANALIGKQCKGQEIKTVEIWMFHSVITKSPVEARSGEPAMEVST